jgi:hypothetical protein
MTDLKKAEKCVRIVLLIREHCLWRINSDESRKMVQLYKTLMTLLVFDTKKACNHGQGTHLLHGSGCIGEGYS